MIRKDIFIIFILISMSSVVVFNNILILPNHWDETYPLGQSWRYIKFFKERKYNLRDWPVNKDDHLPMSNYIIGAVLDLTGWFKWQENSSIKPAVDLSKDFISNLSNSANATYFLLGRITMASFSLLSLLFFYLILRKIFSISVSFLSTLFIGLNPLFIQIAPRLFLEPLLGFFLVVSLFFLINWVKTKKEIKEGDNKLFLLSFAGISSGLCFLTKISGLTSFFSNLTVLIISLLAQFYNLKAFFKSILILICCFIITVVILFPPFWYEPLTLTRNLFLWRLEITKEKQKETPHYSIFNKEKYRKLEFETVSWGGEIRGTGEFITMLIYRMFWYFDPIRRIIKIPGALILFLAGFPRLFVFLISKKRKISTVHLSLTSWLLSFFIIYRFVLLLDQARHYYLLLFPTSILIAYGFEAINILKPLQYKKPLFHRDNK